MLLSKFISYTTVYDRTWRCAMVPWTTHIADTHSEILQTTALLYRILNFQPSVAEPFRLPPLRLGTHYLTTSLQHHPLTYFGTNWKLFCSGDPSNVSALMDLVAVAVT